MDFKKLNEEFRKIIQKNEDKQSLSFSGNKNQIIDIVTKLNQEYGDLTIPEFIDLMIKKEEQGEDILDENLICEDTKLEQSKKAWQSNVDKLMEEIANTKPKVYSRVPWRETSYDDYNYGTGRLKFKIDNHCIEVSFSGEDRRIIDIEFHQIQEDGYVPPDCGYISFSIIPQYEMRRYYYSDYALEDPLRKSLKDGELQIREVRGRTYYFNTYSKQVPCLEFDSIDDTKERKYFAKRVVDIVTNAVDKAVEQLHKRVQENDDKFNTAKNKFAELSIAKRQARANKNANNTTIKQALSKSSIAKKIQALQNPTPEQLARILAAIDIQESMEDDKEPQKRLLLFDGKDVEFLKELMREFGPETSLKKVLEQVKNKETLLQQRK